MEMKRGLAVIATVILLAGIAAAQELPPRPPGDISDVAPFVIAGQQPPQPPQPPQPRQPDLGKWWKNSDIVRELQLSDAQVTQLEQAFFEHRLKLIDMRAAVEREEARLQPLIEADQLDMPKISAQLDTVLAARGQLEKQNTMMMLSLRKVLTVEQWKKLQALHQQREREWETHTPHPGGAPGAPMRRRQPSPEPPAPPRPPEE